MKGKVIILLLLTAVMFICVFSGCSFSDSTTTESSPPTSSPEVASTEEPVALSDEDVLFLSSVLAAVNGEDFFDTANLTNEKIAQILLDVPDLPFAVSSPVKDFLNYYEADGEMGDIYYMVSGQDLETASETVFGRKVSVSQIFALQNISAYLFQDNACGRSIGNGHGSNYAIEIADTKLNSSQVKVYYSIYSTNPYEPDAVPSDRENFIAVFERTADQSKFPFRIVSNLRQGEMRSAEVIAVEKAFEQLMEYSLVQDRIDGSWIVMKLAECSFLRGYTEDSFYYPVADCYLLNLDHDAEPELIVECGQVETASYILDYQQGGFHVTVAEGHPIQKSDGAYYTTVALPGEDEGQILYHINPETLEPEFVEEQHFSLGNYTYWAESDAFHALTPVQKNEWQFILLNDAVRGYYT